MALIERYRWRANFIRRRHALGVEKALEEVDGNIQVLFGERIGCIDTKRAPETINGSTTDTTTEEYLVIR